MAKRSGWLSAYRRAALKRAGDGRCGVEPLESRELFTVDVLTPLSDISTNANHPQSIVVDLAGRFDDPDVVGTVTRFDTVMGEFFVELFDVANGARTAAPLSTAQFLNHANNNLIPGSTTTRFSSYDNTIFHRADAGLGVIQGGGFAFPGFTTLPSGPTVVNEYSETRPNVRGTIAWAKQGGNPDSASNQFFINTDDNSVSLGPPNNGGFTTFGQVLGTGMSVVDAIVGLPVFSVSTNPSMGSQVPLRNTPPNVAGPDSVVLINTVREVDELVLSFTNSDPSLVRVVLEGQMLRLDVQPGRTGTAQITVRATDRTGAFVESSFEVEVTAPANPPTVASLSAATRVSRGTNLKLTATTVKDVSPGSVARVDFFTDTNDNGTFEPGIDTLVGNDASATGGYTLTLPTTGLTAGNYTFFARAVDDQGLGSMHVTRTVQVTNTAPTLTSILTLGTLLRNQAGTISYDLLRNVSNEADANGDAISFRVEQVLSGTLTKNGVAVTPGVTLIGPGESVVWTPALNADGTLDAFSLKAFDGELASAKPVTLKLIVNKPPVVTRIAPSVSVLPFPGSAMKLTATASDPDGFVTRVRFYRDTNGNGTLETGSDAFLAEDSNPFNGVSVDINTSAFPLGAVKFFAQAVDNFSNTLSQPLAYDFTVNTPPTIGQVTATDNVTRPSNITLSALDVTDVNGTIAMVEFFIDLNHNSMVDASDALLNRGVRQGLTNTWSLTLPTTSVPAGEVRFIARATDNHKATVIGSTTVTVLPDGNTTPPTIAALNASAPVVNRGGTFTLTAVNVADPAPSIGGVRRVEFYRDTDGDGAFDPDIDQRIGSDYSSVGGWTANYTFASDFPTGPIQFFARAVDFNGNVSAAVMREVLVNPPPTLGSLTLPATVLRGTNVTLTAVNPVDTQGGTISRVSFYRDSNNNGVRDASDLLLGQDANAAGGYTLSVSTKGLPAGEVRFFAVAVDNLGASSNTVAGVVDVQNNPPTVSSLTASLASPRRGQAVLLTAKGVKDSDGTISKVEFFHDANGDGDVDVGETKLGQDTSAAGGYTFNYVVPLNASPGEFRVLAVATDNNAAVSAPALLTLTILNNLPTLAGLTVSSASVTRPNDVTLTAVNAADLESAATLLVNFYVDTNNNQRLDIGIDALLGSDTDASNGFNFTFSSDLLPALTTVRYIAQAVDPDEGVSTIRSVTQKVIS